MIIYIEKSKDSTKKLELIDEFSQVLVYKINIQKSVVFYTLTMNHQEGKLRKQSHLKHQEIVRDKFIPKNKRLGY